MFDEKTIRPIAFGVLIGLATWNLTSNMLVSFNFLGAAFVLLYSLLNTGDR